MPTASALLLVTLGLLGAERGLEQAVARRNARRLLAAGGIEAGRGHYPAMIGFHLAFFAACAAEALAFPGGGLGLLPRPWPLAASLAALGAALLAQALRWWAVASLGGRWTTRVVVLPGAPPVVKGPYRWLAHPNYLAVAVELLAVPLVGGAVATALLATAGNALLLAVRIPAEERALGPAWAAAFRSRGRRLGRDGAAAAPRGAP